MRISLLSLTIALVLCSCGGGGLDQTELAEKIGAEMANTIFPALREARDAVEHDDLWGSVDQAIDNAGDLGGVTHVARSGGSSGIGGRFAEVAMRLVVVPEGDEAAFCMDFAMASNGELIAEAVPGDPSTFCDDVENVRIRRP